MDILAVDIIFIFDNNFNSKIINLNNNLGDKTLVLGGINKIHLSLCKILVNKNNLKLLELVLDNFKENYSFPKLYFENIVCNNLEDEKTTAIILKQTDEVLFFQKELVKLIKKFNVRCDVLSDMFFEDVNNLTITWTQNSVSNIVRNYNPHISCGFGFLEKNVIRDFNFDYVVAENLVVSYMGNYCSSKKLF